MKSINSKGIGNKIEWTVQTVCMIVIAGLTRDNYDRRRLLLDNKTQLSDDDDDAGLKFYYSL